MESQPCEHDVKKCRQLQKCSALNSETIVSESRHDAIPAISKYPREQHTLSHSHDETQNYVAAY